MQLIIFLQNNDTTPLFHLFRSQLAAPLKVWNELAGCKISLRLSRLIPCSSRVLSQLILVKSLFLEIPRTKGPDGKSRGLIPLFFYSTKSGCNCEKHQICSDFITPQFILIDSININRVYFKINGINIIKTCFNKIYCGFLIKYYIS